MKPKKTGTGTAFGILSALFAHQALACTTEQLNMRQRADIAIDAATGTVLYASNENTHFFQASMTKRMTLLLTLIALRDGRLTRDQIIPLSSIPYNNGRGQAEGKDPIPFIYQQISVWDAVLAMNTDSSNRAPQALGLALANSETAFAQMMNDEAREMGIDAHFENPAGYPTSAEVERTHYITARAHAEISRRLFAEFPNEMNELRIGSAKLTGYTAKGRAVGFRIGTTNKFMPGQMYYVPEIEGGKTGTSCAAGASIEADWRVNGRLVIGVTSGHATGAARYDTLMNYMRRPDDVFLTRLDNSRRIEEEQAMTRALQAAYGMRRVRWDFNDGAARNFAPAGTQVKAEFRKAHDGPDRKDQPAPDFPFMPPGLAARIEYHPENNLRPVII